MFRFLALGAAALVAWVVSAMVAQTGRTNKRWIYFIVGDTSNVLRNIPVDSVNGVGLDYKGADVTAFQDAIKNVLPETPDCKITVTGPFDNTAAASSPTLSGSHTVLSVINGDGVPHTIDIQVGIQHAWTSGEPEFGLSRSATVGFVCTKYDVNLTDMKYTAEFQVFGGTAPAWGTTART